MCEYMGSWNMRILKECARIFYEDLEMSKIEVLA